MPSRVVGGDLTVALGPVQGKAVLRLAAGKSHGPGRRSA